MTEAKPVPKAEVRIENPGMSVIYGTGRDPKRSISPKPKDP